MEIIIGAVVYLIVVGMLMSFGRFLKECDESINELTKLDSVKKV